MAARPADAGAGLSELIATDDRAPAGTACGVVGPLVASEGFTSVEELAMVDVKELAGIEGFDEETATELQT
ncbi:hypothetical protein K4G94_23180, partial [Mycobacterium tuberculosis]|nr:hypothetical protein [Mycobacterium tuberculosis]